MSEQEKKTDDSDYQNLNFYSDPAGRIRKATGNHKWMVSMQNQKKLSFVRSFFSSRASVMLFIAILVLIAFFGIFSKIDVQDTVMLDGCEFSASAFYFNDSVYLTISKSGTFHELRQGFFSLTLNLDSGSSKQSELQVRDETNQTWYVVCTTPVKPGFATISIMVDQETAKMKIKIGGKSP